MARKRIVALWVGGLVAVLGVLVALALIRSGDEPFETTVVRMSTSGNSICVDREENDCGIPIIHPDDAPYITEGAAVMAEEIWLDRGNGGEVLAFYVTPLTVDILSPGLPEE